MSSIIAQVTQAGFNIVGQLRRCPDLEPSHLYKVFTDEANNEFILRRGILTIVTAEGNAI